MNVKALSNEKADRKVLRVVIADDHAVVRRGIRDLLRDEPGLEVCHEARDGSEAVEYVKQHKPDLLLLDLTMPGLNGLDALRQVRQIAPATRVLILTMHFSEEVARAAFQLGAQGFILKSDADTDLLTAVRHARENKRFFTERLAGAMVDSFVQQHGAPESSQMNFAAGSGLTCREIEIVKMLASGMSNKQIAPAIGLSIRTVESHRNHIMHKMKFGSFSELIRFAIRQCLIES
jgi:DNA-binding NarL/FixJ family response regulator